jgi:V/A-type H+-transporting ATPase subunit E
MSSKLQELTERIYKEGVEKGQQEAATILEAARAEAERVLTEARAEAERIATKSREDAEFLRTKTIAEVRAASEQLVAGLKQRVVDLVSRTAFAAPVKEALSDPAFLRQLILQTISRWNPDTPGLALVLPEESRQELETYLGAAVRDGLAAGCRVSYEGRFEQGFTIGPKDGSFAVSFTDRDFVALFQTFVKARTREILFPEG